MKKAAADPSTREFLEQNAVFTTAEFRSALPPETPSSTLLNRLQQAYRRGYIDRIGHGVYASRVGTFSEGVPDPLLVASKLAPDCVIGYHSALEAHGVAHTPFRRVTFLSSRLPFEVTYRDYQFKALRPPRSLVANEAWNTSTAQLRRGNQLITATSRERTLVDCMDNLKWGGGIEEVLRSVGGFPSLDVEKIIGYLDLLRSASATAKVGWAISTDPDLWKITPAELEALQSRLGKGPYFLAQRREQKTLAREWHLYVPVGFDAHGALRG